MLGRWSICFRTPFRRLQLHGMARTCRLRRYGASARATLPPQLRPSGYRGGVLAGHRRGVPDHHRPALGGGSTGPRPDLRRPAFSSGLLASPPTAPCRGTDHSLSIWCRPPATVASGRVWRLRLAVLLCGQILKTSRAPEPLAWSLCRYYRLREIGRAPLLPRALTRGRHTSDRSDAAPRTLERSPSDWSSIGRLPLASSIPARKDRTFAVPPPGAKPKPREPRFSRPRHQNRRYGTLSAFDLVSYRHRPAGRRARLADHGR